MSDQPDAKHLRKAAEARLAGRTPLVTTQSADELFHELQVSQIELEIQNENLRQSQFELEQSRGRYMDFYDLAPVGYLTLSANSRILEINLTGAGLLGLSRDELLYRSFSPHVAAEYSERWQQNFNSVLASDAAQSCELALLRCDGSKFFARLDCLRQRKFDESLVVRVVLIDISDRIRNEEEIRKLAFYDALTLLPNRRLLNDRLDQAMAASKRSGKYGALMFVDLDNFKPLNDKHGHNIGDMLLVEVARRITGCLREMDSVARFGGDEFVVLLSELHEDRNESVAQAEIVAEKIRSVLAEPYTMSTRNEPIEHSCTSSIGVVLFINHLSHPDDVLKWADMAMYQAKAKGRNQVVFFERERPQ